MRLDYDNSRTRAAGVEPGAERVEEKTPLELLEEFYLAQNGQSMGEEQRAFARELMEEIWGDER